MGIALFNEPVNNDDPFSDETKYSEATIDVDLIYLLKKSDEISKIKGLSVFDIIEEYLKNKNATIVSIQRKHASVIYTEPLYETAKDVEFRWYVVKWKDTNQDQVYCFAILENKTIIEGTPYSEKND